MVTFNYGPFSKTLAADASKIKYTYLLYLLLKVEMSSYMPRLLFPPSTALSKLNPLKSTYT